MATARAELKKDEATEKESKTVNPTSVTRVTVAFPFSTVKIAQDSDATTELASIVAELALALAEGAPGPSRLKALAALAEEIAAR